MRWEELEDALEVLETEREYDGYFCSIKAAVIIVILGSLCDLQSVKKIHAWATTEHVRKFLEETFGIKRIPCYWWLLSLLGIIRPESLNECMKQWVASVVPELAAKLEAEENEQSKQKKKTLTIAIDGKEIRSTGKMKKYDNPLHIISAQIGELGLTLAQRTVATKSNEIPAVPELIKELAIPGCMVVADAMNCQIETAEAIVEAKADYLLSAKGNQQALMNDIAEYVHDTKLRAKMDRVSRTERGHGRKETRRAYTSADVSWQPGGRVWPELKCIGALHTRFETSKGVTEEWHYYISSKALRAQELLHHAREEWSVESMHWLLDVHFDEDRCRVQSKNVQQNLNMLHKCALNITRIHKRETQSKLPLNGIMFGALMNPQALLPLLGKT
ncbi:transposase, IS4 family [Treponema socranskii subsp. socranskii VPI DR56BR1116 = ATCC 35536]|uniref:Transposase, IS4 family n=5 Tax=Treponema socranskii TaxID=53419 RepID=A0ABN0P7Q9_TRESO|nr:ISAs1 family transposase [Treponema socranskii]ERK04352.1 transposase, IS4 family [Treponema socranskii subsp. socranskii VPI DR56BR1116 = ATCC 35536]